MGPSLARNYQPQVKSAVREQNGRKVRIMNSNLIFEWLREDRYATEPDVAAEDAETVFLSVEIEAANSPVAALASVPSERIEIELPGGCHVSAKSGFDVVVLAWLLK